MLPISNRSTGCELYHGRSCYDRSHDVPHRQVEKPGVYNVEEFDPDPFMEQLNKQGLPWHEVFNGDIEL